LKRRITLAVDVDGPLADFIVALFHHFNADIYKYYWHGVDNDYQEFKKYLPVDDLVIWRSLPQTFWEYMPVTPWCHALLKLCDLFDSYIISAPPRYCPEAYSGRLIWAMKHLLKYVDSGQFFLGRAKERTAIDRSVILIDDCNENCEKFVATGGSAIWFPMKWNVNHGVRGNKVAFVAHQIKTIGQNYDFHVPEELDVFVKSLKD
jgi:5'(3')-deoxyribonucleotidase